MIDAQTVLIYGGVGVIILLGIIAGVWCSLLDLADELSSEIKWKHENVRRDIVQIERTVEDSTSASRADKAEIDILRRKIDRIHLFLDLEEVHTNSTVLQKRKKK